MINIGNFNIYPNDIDYVKLEQQGLCKDGNLNDTYFKLYNTYLSLFYDILNDNGLNCFDNDLENSNLHFNQVEKEDMDMYQSNSIFKYFYVRNNLYLEKLSNEDIENLLSNDSNKKDIVLRTFKDIINIDDDYKVCYGPDTDNFWYDSERTARIALKYMEVVRKKNSLKKAVTNAERMKVNKSIKTAILDLEKEDILT